MRDARVLVVDDSAAMRALFCDILDQARNVSVVGVAASAAEARTKIHELRPNVVTLDVEMPGMSGMEFLAEIMAENPLPVVMLSSVTQIGTGTAQKALDLGAIECFPKPLHSSQEDFNASVSKLGKIVLDAANTDMEERAAAMAAAAANDSGFVWNGTLVALTGGEGAIETLKEMLPAFPANCPPTVICLPGDPAQARALVSALAPAVACTFKLAQDGDAMVPGFVYLACDPDQHVVVEKGEPPVLRLLDRDPVAGVRPSADLLFGSLSRCAVPVAAAVLSGHLKDGVRGLAMLREAGALALTEDPISATSFEGPQAAEAAGAEPVSILELRKQIIARCSA